jgi:hypothetical protein
MLLKKKNFCSTLSEFENFLLCERILINVTTCQNEMYSTRSCVNWAFFGMSEPV